MLARSDSGSRCDSSRSRRCANLRARDSPPRVPRQESEPFGVAPIDDRIGLPVAQIAQVLHRHDRRDLPRALELRNRKVRPAKSMRSSLRRARLPSHASLRCSGPQFGVHRSGPGRSSPPLVAITRPAGYGCSAFAMMRSETSGPYESAVSIRLTPSSTARRNTRIASSWFAGGPQSAAAVPPQPRARKIFLQENPRVAFIGREAVNCDACKSYPLRASM